MNTNAFHRREVTTGYNPVLLWQLQVETLIKYFIYFTTTPIPTSIFFAKYLFACLLANKLIITILLIAVMLRHIEEEKGGLKSNFFKRKN